MLAELAMGVALGIGIAGVVRLRGRWRRHRAVARIPAEAVRRRADDVTMRVHMQGGRIWPGMSRRYVNRTRGELVLTDQRFLLVTNRGVLLDLEAASGRGLESVRCTGPGRLVIEGEVPMLQDQPARYRIELPLPDAVRWADALRPFVHGDPKNLGWRPPEPSGR